MNTDSLHDFWNRLRTGWNGMFAGVDLERVALAMIILAAAFLMRRLVANLFLRLLRGALRGLGQKAADGAVAALHPPVQVLPVVFGLLVVTDLVADNERLASIGHDLARSLVVFALFWALYRGIVPFFQRLDDRTSVFTDSMLGVAVAGSRIVIVALGAATVLEIWGIKVGPILAGFGLVGAAVALGAQDLFKNLIGGIFIIAERRFQIGDWIRADGVCEGTVEKIGLRTTKIRRFDLSPIYVPNAQLSDNPVTNYQQMTFRQISWMVGLTYDTTVDQLRQVRDGIEAYLKAPDFVQPPEAPLFVRIDSFGDSAINLMVYCFTRSTDWGEWLGIKEKLVYGITDIVEKAGSGFAFPSQSIYVETLPQGTAFLPGTPGAAGGSGAPSGPPAMSGTSDSQDS